MDVRTQRRYTLAGEFALFMPERAKATEERKRAVAYFADWVEPRQRDVKTILETLPVLMHSLRWGVKFGMAAEVMRITKSLELHIGFDRSLGILDECLVFGRSIRDCRRRQSRSGLGTSSRWHESNL